MVDATLMLGDILVDLLNLRKIDSLSCTDLQQHRQDVSEYLSKVDLEAVMTPFCHAQATNFPNLHEPDPFVQALYEGLLVFFGIEKLYFGRECGQF